MTERTKNQVRIKTEERDRERERTEKKRQKKQVTTATVERRRRKGDGQADRKTALSFNTAKIEMKLCERTRRMIVAGRHVPL